MNHRLWWLLIITLAASSCAIMYESGHGAAYGAFTGGLLDLGEMSVFP